MDEQKNIEVLMAKLDILIEDFKEYKLDHKVRWRDFENHSIKEEGVFNNLKWHFYIGTIFFTVIFSAIIYLNMALINNRESYNKRVKEIEKKFNVEINDLHRRSDYYEKNRDITIMMIEEYKRERYIKKIK